MNIAANKQEQFEALCRVDRPRGSGRRIRHYAERHARLRHRYALKAELESALDARRAQEWWPLLTQAGVPSGPVYTVEQALAHPQVRDRGMVATFTDVPGVGRDVRVVRTGFKLDGAAPAVDNPPPMLGQHNDELLAQLGYGPDEIRQLKEQGAV